MAAHLRGRKSISLYDTVSIANNFRQMRGYINNTFCPGAAECIAFGSVIEKAVVLLNEVNAVLKGELLKAI